MENLLPATLTPVENVTLTFKVRLLPILEQLGLNAEETKWNVLKLSEGNKQRVPIAHALASDHTGYPWR